MQMLPHQLSQHGKEQLRVMPRPEEIEALIVGHH